MTTNAYVGFGTELNLGTAVGGPFTKVAQLKNITPEGSKAQMVDRTNVLTPDNGTRTLPVRIDTGELDIVGVLDPANTSILQLGTLHASLTPVFAQLVLPGGTEYTFQCFVSQYVPWTIPYNKALGFTARLRVNGLLTGPAGAA
jgi:hypothetical protein